MMPPPEWSVTCPTLGPLVRTRAELHKDEHLVLPIWQAVMRRVKILDKVWGRRERFLRV